jgi:hypothetical protein
VTDSEATQKGWFSPYLYASGRKPIIPKSMMPDIVFCHGPFTQGLHTSFLVIDSDLTRSTGDYSIGTTLLAQSASVVAFCDPPTPEDLPKEEENGEKDGGYTATLSSLTEKLHLSSNKGSDTETDRNDNATKAEDKAKDTNSSGGGYAVTVSSLTKRFGFSNNQGSNSNAEQKESSGAPAADQKPSREEAPSQPPPPRRMVILLVGLKPHRKIWSSSARPSESVMYYILQNGTPAIVIPVKTGAPLVSWDALTLSQLWKIPVPAEDERSPEGKFEGVVEVLTEFVELCIDWDRVSAEGEQQEKKSRLHDALKMLVAGAIRTQNSEEAKREVDPDRAGIAMWRIP